MSLADIASPLISAATGGDFNRAYLEDAEGTRVILDVVPDHQRDANTTVSRHAVESAEGSISDNVLGDPRSITLKVIFSNYTGMNFLNPFSYVRSVRAMAGFTEDIIRDRIELLYKWRDLGWLLTYYSKRIEMKNCVIQKITETVNEATGDGVGVALTLTEVRIANAKVVSVDLLPQGAKKTDSSNKSVMKRMAPAAKRWINGIFG